MDISQPISWLDTKAALSAVTLHRGLLFAPLGYDHGGGQGRGAFALYDINDPTAPRVVFDSRDYPDRYHDPASHHYVGDFAEAHAICMSGDAVLMSERRPQDAGFSILDLSPLFDDDPETLPAVMGRFTYPHMRTPSNYDGFSFSPVWQAGRYVYAPTGSGGLYVVDTTDWNAPYLIAHLPRSQLFNQTMRSAHLVGNTLMLSPAAVASNDSELIMLDVSTPAAPQLLSRTPLRVAYQGFVYGRHFYNGGTRATVKSRDLDSQIIRFDYGNPQAVTSEVVAETGRLFKPEYGFGQDGHIFIGHYPGMSKWRFATDANGADVLTHVADVEPQFPPADDYAFLSPLGNLIAVTSDHNVESRLNIGVHQREADTAPPRLLHAEPMPGAARVPRSGAVGLAFSDFVDPLSVHAGTVALRVVGSSAAIPARYGHVAGVVSVSPDAPLAADTSYEVVAHGAGPCDQVGNPFHMDGGEITVLTRFTTGSELSSSTIALTTDEPQAAGHELRVQAEVLGAALADPILHWDLGDGATLTTDSLPAQLPHRYGSPGNYVITVRSAADADGRVLRSSAVQVVHPPLPQDPAISSGSLAYHHGADQVAVVNPDNHSVTVIDGDSLAVLREVELPGAPATVTASGDRWWVTIPAADVVVAVDRVSGRIVEQVALGYGSAPYGIVAAADYLYVVASGSGEVLELDPVAGITRRCALGAGLRHLGYSPAHDQLVVPQFRAQDQQPNWVALLDRSGFSLRKQVRLAEVTTPDGVDDGRGMANYLSAPAFSVDQHTVWIPGKKDNLRRGLQRDGEALTFDHTVRSMVAAIDLRSGVELVERALDLDNSDFATAACVSAHGAMQFIATLGSSVIWVVDAYDAGRRFSVDAGGLAPSALLVNASGSRLFVHNALSRQVAVFESPDGVVDSGVVFHRRSISTVTNERLDPQVLAGKRLFHDSRSPMLSQEGYMSCAACHADGGHDGRVWDLTQMGEGWRNTIDLRGKQAMGHGPLHWTANFDELHDFEIQIRALNQGLGLLPYLTYHAQDGVVQPPYGAKKAGLHEELDALAAYVASLDAFPRSPERRPDGSLSPAASAGRQLFAELDCIRCHRGATFTDSTIGRLHEVDTQGAHSGGRLGGAWQGVDTPSLIATWDSAPYLHDGSAPTIAEAIQRHQVDLDLNDEQLAALTSYIRSLDGSPGEALGKVSDNNPPQFSAASFEFACPVNAEPGTVLGRVRAHDPDPGDTLWYTIRSDGDGALFAIDPADGTLCYQGADLYGRKEFNLTVVVEDDGDVIASTAVPVTVRHTFPEPVIDEVVRNGARITISWRHLGSGFPQSYAVLAGPSADQLRVVGRRQVAKWPLPKRGDTYTMTVELADPVMTHIALRAIDHARQVRVDGPCVVPQ
ncbi:MAG: Ig-like domain-containing protein [Planctomycetota bacterium]